MKLDWFELDRTQKEFLEFPWEHLFFLMRFGPKKIICGTLKQEVCNDSIEVQVQNLLGLVKRSGASRDSVSLSILGEEGSKVSQQIISEFQRFRINPKCKLLSRQDKYRIRIDPQSGELWISKVVVHKEEVKSIEIKKTKVLIIEDSVPIQKILQKVYSEIPHVQVVGTVGSIRQALELFESTKPDFISLDMKLEDGTGLEFLERSNFLACSREKKVRCVLVTDCSVSDGLLVFDAMAMGVSSYIQKPQVANLKDFATELADLLKELFVADEHAMTPKKENLQKSVDLTKYKLIAIGSSTGGTEVVRDLIGGFPSNCPPVVVVQHMPPHFTGLFADRIQKQTGRPTLEIKERVQLTRGHAYIAAGSTHLVIEERERELFARTKDGDLVNRFKPSVSVLFKSILEAGLSSKTIALMLTGMGSDGAKEMLQLKEAGALTVGQSKESCVVYGMPRAAAEIGALCWSASPIQLINLMNDKERKLA